MRPLVLLALLVAAPARANMADPVQPGDPVGEPSAALAALSVVSERLAFDLRPLAEGGAAIVEAVYVIQNPGAARTLPLVFVAPAIEAEGTGVWVDGRPVAFAPYDGALPDAWAAPATTPGFDGADLEYRTEAYGGAVRFDVPLGSGRHEVRVRYLARAGTYDPSQPSQYHQVGYVLAPARQWGSFGRLDVEVRVPEGWEAAASLPLARDGDTLAGTFDGVPADVLGLTVRAPRPWGIWPLRLLGVALGFGLCWGAGRGVGGWLGRRGRPSWWALPVALAAGVVGAVAFAVPALASYALGDSNAYGYGAWFVVGLMGFPLALLVGTVVAQMTAVRAVRRAVPSAIPAAVPAG